MTPAPPSAPSSQPSLDHTATCDRLATRLAAKHREMTRLQVVLEDTHAGLQASDHGSHPSSTRRQLLLDNARRCGACSAMRRAKFSRFLAITALTSTVLVGGAQS